MVDAFYIFTTTLAILLIAFNFLGVPIFTDKYARYTGVLLCVIILINFFINIPVNKTEDECRVKIAENTGYNIYVTKIRDTDSTFKYEAKSCLYESYISNTSPYDTYKKYKDELEYESNVKYLEKLRRELGY